MSILEKTAYLRGLADGLGVDPQSKEGRLWAALNDVLGEIAQELTALKETDLSQGQALERLADEVSLLEDICGEDDFGEDDFGEDENESGKSEEDEELEYDGVIYDATCPVCGEEISFDEETLERGSIECPNCGETLEFDLGEDEEGEKGEESDGESKEECKF